jgi:Fe-S-cluster-containing dehydrogenase component
MKKCTLCVDRIYNETFPRKTASRPACAPARRAHGISAISTIRTVGVSRLVAERGGIDLMPEQATRPVNKYLPPRLARRRARQTRIIPCILPFPSSSSPSRRAPGLA